MSTRTITYTFSSPGNSNLTINTSTAECAEGLHYRWSGGDIALEPGAAAGLAEPVMLRLAYEPGTPRRWSAPEPARERRTLRIVG